MTILSTSQAALLLGIHRRSVQRLIVAGVLKAWRNPGPRGRWRIPRENVEELLAERASYQSETNGTRETLERRY